MIDYTVTIDERRNFVSCPACGDKKTTASNLPNTGICEKCGTMFTINRLAEQSAARSAPDPVNRPEHYIRGGIECIDVIEALGLGYHLGNALKYLWRCGHKADALEDLKKARWYLDREIRRRESDGA